MTESSDEQSEKRPSRGRPPAPQSRGRHARPPSDLSVRWDRLVGGPRRRAAVAVAGTAAVALIAAVAVMALPGGGSGGDPRAEVAAHTARPSTVASAETEAFADPDEVPEAVPYFETRDPGRKVVGHVTEVRRSGTFIRVYTDLGEDDENSKAALSLCEWTTQFLKDGGDDEPRVFVHGKSSDNGSVVLANKQSDKDDCEVAETR
ncbi:hypothetical protein AGRA3207_001282 [Actinomadura graeca]|uniref:Uncharacterized protein n=1 Tax=Actinomadura graeca TaxID=2750812 RepID=A0ABX8QPA3_9ACTN|nr:hypothetical protein [Actinomadura graeca]QXJ20552.1 hypothetical protein AGRA3207_001282 [Actinomadura graeca]